MALALEVGQIALKDFLRSLNCGEQVFRRLRVQTKSLLSCDDRTVVIDCAPAIDDVALSGRGRFSQVSMRQR